MKVWLAKEAAIWGGLLAARSASALELNVDDPSR